MFKISYKKILLTVTILTVTSLSAAEAPFTTFESNTVAKASEVNDNFIYLQSGIDAVEGTKQNRVSGTCAVGQVISAINADGSVSCKADIDTDTNTVYSASTGSGINLVGTAFSIDTDETQRRVGGLCGTGYAIRAINSSGGVTCGTTVTAGMETSSYSSVLNLPADNSVYYIRTVYVTVPSAGFIYVSGSFQHFIVHTVNVNDDSTVFGIHNNNTETDISTTSAGASLRVSYLPISSVASGNYTKSFHTQREFFVSGAGTYIYYLVGRRTDNGTTNVNRALYPSLTAIFVPNGY